jgi:hypothetical protein
MEHEAHAWLAAIEASPFAVLMRESLWLYPLAGVLHVVGIGLLLGSIVAFDLRVLGAARAVPLADAARWLLPIARGGFVLAALTGAAMFSADATHLADNPAFLVKGALILLAGINVLLFHLVLWRGEPVAGPLTRRSALASAALWVCVASAGRLIAYF